MNEKEFFGLDHQLGPMHLGTPRVELDKGYRPDATVTDRGGSLKYIIEFETTTSRKAFLGGMTKAEFYAETHGIEIDLLFVITERPNTRKQSIRDHLAPYLTWMKARRLDKFGIQNVLIISDEAYRESTKRMERFGLGDFIKRCMVAA